MNTKVMFSSDKEDWATPQEFFDKLNDEFHFTLDSAASESNHKCEKYYTKDNSGLNQEWDKSTYCNPPYGRGYSNGFKRLTWRALKVKLLLCCYLQELIRSSFTNLSMEKPKYAF